MRGLNSRSGSARRIERAAFEALERRQLLDGLLPDVAPNVSLGFPVIGFDSQGAASAEYTPYAAGNPSSQVFHVNAPLMYIVISDTEAYPIVPISDPAQDGVMDLKMHIDSNGAIVPDTDQNLNVIGDIDENVDSLPNDSVQGTLLTGKIEAVGFDFNTNHNGYFMNFRFTPTGGKLADSYAGQDIGMVMVLGTTTTAPSFGDHFTRTAQGELGSIPPIPHALPGAIRGMKFNDSNGDGIKEDGEQGIEGWKIQLFDGSGNPIGSPTQTDASGNYSFTGLQPGTYYVREVQDPAYIQTTVDPDTVTVVDGNQFDNVNFGNFKLVSLSGIKFDDVNGNHAKDAGEGGLEGWTIHIKNNTTGQELTTTTGSDGSYTFTGLKPGTYVFSEDQQPGWTMTLSPDAFTVESGKDKSGFNFGNFKLGSISGVKFNDLNGNGTQQSGENGLGGWTIDLLNSSDVIVDTKVTASDGSFSFTGLLAGDYHVQEEGKTGWIQTTSVLGPVTVSSGSAITGQNLGNFQLGSISGLKYNDLNGNGVQDSGEGPLSGWTIDLLDSTNTVIATYPTGADGTFSFTGLKAGTYTIKEESQGGWLQTSSVLGPVTVVSGSTITHQDLGNYKLGSISGIKFEDVNGNGAKDGGESGLKNWTINLLNSSNVIVDTQITASDGSFTFSNLPQGVYHVVEVGQGGWVQTTAVLGNVSITTSGTVITGQNIGNFKLGSISGLKFNDCNGNKVQDTGELGLQGWTINLVNSSNVIVDTKVTGSDGSFTFTNVGPGTYHLTEVGQTGWTQTVAPGNVVMLSGLVSTGNAFGNRKTTSMICGIKFEDHDGDGIKDGNDQPLAGWTIYLDLNCNGYLDCNEPYDVTDANGAYCLTVNKTGTYKVREVTKCGWTQTLGKSGYSVYVGAIGPDYTGYDFGNFDNISICGHKFYDGNANGKDDECMWVQGLRINLFKDANSNGVYDSCVDTLVCVTRTDCYGNFCFSDVGPGTYFVQEDLASLCGVWIKTFGGAGYTINASSGTDRKDLKFGNVKIGGTGAEDICYWTSCYGENKIFDGCSAVSELMLLNSLNLSNSKGALPNFSISGSGSNGLCQLANWLESANSCNMAYELSAQFAIMELNVEAHYVSGTEKVYAAQLLPFMSNVNSTPGLVDGGIDSIGFITIRDLLTATNVELGKDPTTITTSTARAYQTALEQVLQLANDDKIFVQ